MAVMWAKEGIHLTLYSVLELDFLSLYLPCNLSGITFFDERAGMCLVCMVVSDYLKDYNLGLFLFYEVV